MTIFVPIFAIQYLNLKLNMMMIDDTSRLIFFRNKYKLENLDFYSSAKSY